MEKKINSVQNWIYIKEIYNNGIIKLKNDSYVKILKILPIIQNIHYKQIQLKSKN